MLRPTKISAKVFLVSLCPFCLPCICFRFPFGTGGVSSCVLYSAWHPGDLCGKVSDFPSPGSWPERACVPGAARMPERKLAGESSFTASAAGPPCLEGRSISQGWAPGGGSQGRWLRAGCCYCFSGGTSGFLFFGCV